jgi:hypothetical protein
MKRIICMVSAIAILNPCETFARSRLPLPVVEEQFTVSLPNGSSDLSDSNKVTLARHIPRINSIILDIVAVTLWTSYQVQKADAQELSPLNFEANVQKLGPLDLKRKQSIRGFFVDFGVPEKRIYFEAKSLNSQIDAHEPPEGRKDGLIQIWYRGDCKNHESMCFDRNDAQPIIQHGLAR